MTTGEVIALIKAFGGGGSGGDNRFIVTLTPTALDYSGTMDKTVAEINEAYEAGQEILFDVRVAGNVTLRVTMTEVYIDTGYDFPSFQVNVMVDSTTMMKAYTGTTNDGTEQTYHTMVYGV